MLALIRLSKVHVVGAMEGERAPSERRKASVKCNLVGPPGLRLRMALWNFLVE